MTKRRSLRDVLPVGPGGDRVVALAFNPPSTAIVAAIGRGPEAPAMRLFIRGGGDTSYREIVPPTQRGYFVDFAVASNAAMAVLLVGDSAEPNHRELHRVTLPDGALARIPFEPFEPAGEHTWIAQLLSTDPDGRTVYAVVGVTPWPQPRDAGFSVAYSIAAVDSIDGTLRLVAKLDSPYA